jgi:hypothetical protein
MRSYMCQSLLKGGFHLFGGRFRKNLRSHMIQVLFKVFGGSAMLALQRAFDYLGKIALGRHVRGASL